MSKRIAHLFERQTRAFEDLIGRKSGMAEFAMDECEIDPDRFTDSWMDSSRSMTAGVTWSGAS